MSTTSVPSRPARQTAWFFARISLFWFGLSFMWGGLNIQFWPHRVPQLVGKEWQGTAIGLILFVGLAVAILVQPVAGALSDRARFRWGRRRPYMLVGVLAALPFLVLIGLAENYWLLFGLVLCLQIASNLAHGPYQGIIPDLVRPAARGRASGYFGLANLLGTLVGAGVAGVFLGAGMVLPAMLVMVAMLLLTMVASWLCVREPPPPEPEPFRGILVELFQRVRELRARSAFIWLVLSRLFFFMGLQAMDNFIQLFLRERLHEPDPELKTTVVMAAVILLALVACLPAGWAADRLGRLRLVALAAGLGVVSSVLLLFAQSFVQVVVFAAFLGVGLGFFTVADWAVLIDQVPDERAPGLYMGLTNIGQAGGDALATLTAGIALDVFNRIEPGLGYSAPFGMMGIYFLISLAVLAIVRSRIARASVVPSD